jgi:hypothetical protein
VHNSSLSSPVCPGCFPYLWPNTTWTTMLLIIVVGSRNYFVKWKLKMQYVHFSSSRTLECVMQGCTKSVSCAQTNESANSEQAATKRSPLIFYDHGSGSGECKIKSAVQEWQGLTVWQWDSGYKWQLCKPGALGPKLLQQWHCPLRLAQSLPLTMILKIF